MQDEGATKRRELPFPKTEPSIRKIRGKYVSLSPSSHTTLGVPLLPREAKGISVTLSGWSCVWGTTLHFCMGRGRSVSLCFVWCCWVCGKVIDPPQRVYRVGMLTRKIEEGTAMERAEAVAERPAMARRTAEGRPHDGADEDDDAPHEEAVDVL
ncbi:hypothetical protein B296_00036840 [Ensete ventricosum]|uniref:Uncharacterized protein n=1 Tax=Ensete ventricosum TaxID=4639 RepID=A0A426ZAL6_ENSVE|nr:hypothetical protein B296_00036840 [Ensete ventricosum]